MRRTASSPSSNPSAAADCRCPLAPGSLAASAVRPKTPLYGCSPAHQRPRRAQPGQRAARRDRHRRRGRPALRLRQVARPAAARGELGLPCSRRGASAAGHHHDLHGRHRARGPRPARPRLRRRGARSSTTPRAPGCTPRRGCSGATPASTPPTSAHRTSRAAALLDGVEWNVRLSPSRDADAAARSSRHLRHLLERQRVRAYDPDRDRDRLDDALAEASGRRQHDRVTISPVGSRGARRIPYQQEMLDALEVERSVHDRHRNLVVAATGHRQDRGRGSGLPTPVRSGTPASGRACCSSPTARRSWTSRCAPTARCWPTRTSASCTSVAHGPSAGSTSSPASSRCTSYGVDNIPADAFDVVVIDEFHHAEAPTYRRLLDHLQPRELLGLTATPERADGVDVRALLRRAHRRRAAPVGRAGRRPAVPVPLLRGRRRHRPAPDQLDARAVRRGAAGERLHRQRARAAIVLAQLRDKVADVRRDAGARVLRERRARRVHGAASSTRPASRPCAVSGQTPPARAAAALEDLRDRAVNILFAATCSTRASTSRVDTVLFLRPTESATSSCSSSAAGCAAPGQGRPDVLDFIGQHRKEFRFDVTLPALTGQHPTRRRA